MSLSALHDRRIFDTFLLSDTLISIDFSTTSKIMKQQKILNLIAVCASALLLAGCSDTESAAYKAAQALSSGDFETAGAVADSAIKATGGDKLMYRTKGIAALAAGDYDAATDALISALYCSNGIVDQADIDISYYLAVAEYKKGDHESAKQTADAILGMRPKDDAAYFLRGKINLAMGNKAEAVSDFDSTIKLAPDNYDRYVGIYEELHAKGYDAEAAGYLEKAMSAGNKLSDYNKGVLEYYLASYTDARTDLENARKKGDSENLALYLGRTYEALGDSSYAMTIYEEYLRTDSSAGKIYEQLAACRMQQGMYEEALDTIETGLSLGGGEGMQGLMFDRVVAYERLYDFDSAKKSMDEYLAVFPDDEVAKRENVFLSSR